MLDTADKEVVIDSLQRSLNTLFTLVHDYDSEVSTRDRLVARQRLISGLLSVLQRILRNRRPFSA